MNKTVLFIRSSFGINGPGTFALHYAIELRKRGFRVVFCGDADKLNSEIQNEGFDFYTIHGLGVGRARLAKSLQTIFLIRKILHQEKVQIVTGFNASATFLSLVAAGMNRNHIRFFSIINGEGKEWFLRFFQFLPWKYLAVSHYLKQHLVNSGIKENRIFVISPSTITEERFNLQKSNPNKLRTELGIGQDAVLIGSVAGFIKGATGSTKGQDCIMRAIPLVLCSCPNAVFIFVGEGPNRGEIEDMAASLNVQSHAFFTGARRDMPDVFAGFDIYCQYPDQETFGLVLTEAMIMERPVVARRIGAIPEIVQDGETGYLVESVKEMANKLILLTKNPSERLRMGKAGKQRALENFVLSKCVDSLIALYEQ